MKRYIYIIIGIIVLAILAILALIFIKNRSSSTATPVQTTTGSLPAATTQTSSSSATQTTTIQTNPSTIISLGTSSPTSANNQGVAKTFGLLSNQPVLNYYIDAQNTITAIQPSGAIISISDGQTSILSSSTIENIISASFSYDGEKALITSGDQTNSQSAVFDIKTQKWTTLPQGIQSPQWATNTYQVAYLSSVGTGQEALSIINVASIKSGVATLITLNANDLTLQWPNKTQFIISDKPTAYNSASAWLFNSATASLTPIIYETTGLESIWSHTTSTLGIVFSDGASGQNKTLRLESALGNALQTINFLTLPSKCLFNTEKTATSTSTTSSSYIALYCGIPRSTTAFSSARLPDDYETMALFSSDDIYKVNTTNGQTQILWNDQTQNMDASNLKIFNNTLFFINRYDQKLYGLLFQ